MTVRPRIAVVGAGVSGLATAYYLRHCDEPTRPEVILIEGSDRLGGKVLTREVSGMAVDVGPDTLVFRSAQIRSLIEELGLTGALILPGVSGSYVWARGRLRAIPPGLLFGLPDRILPLLRSGILSPRGVARASLDVVLPRRRIAADASVSDLVRPRLGAEVLTQLVEPLLAGAHAGRADLLSAQGTVPEIDALARQNRSLYLGMRRRQRQRSAPLEAGPAVVTLQGGLNQLVDSLADALSDCEVLVGNPVTSFEQTRHRYRLTLSDSGTLNVDAVVFATPAFNTAELLAAVLPAASTALREMPYADVATITLAYPREALTCI